jgi:hypothetical protein
MGNELFGIDLAGILADALGDGLLDVTITRYVYGERDPNALTRGRSRTPVIFECKGFWEDYADDAPPGITVEVGDRKAVLLGDTIPAGGIPQKNDMITVHEEAGDSSLYVWLLQSRDPAAAVYVFQCRDRQGPDGV